MMPMRHVSSLIGWNDNGLPPRTGAAGNYQELWFVEKGIEMLGVVVGGWRRGAGLASVECLRQVEIRKVRIELLSWETEVSLRGRISKLFFPLTQSSPTTSVYVSDLCVHLH